MAILKGCDVSLQFGETVLVFLEDGFEEGDDEIEGGDCPGDYTSGNLIGGLGGILKWIS